MPLRYSKHRMKILKSVAALQRRGALDETLYRNFLRWYGKALRQLQRAEDKRQVDVLRRATTKVFRVRGLEFVGVLKSRKVIPASERPVSEMWAEKHARQAADIAGIESGELSADDVNWFAGGLARRAKILTPLFPDVPDAPPSVVDLLSNSEQKSDEWLQQPGEHSFDDEMNGISPEERQKLDADKQAKIKGELI